MWVPFLVTEIEGSYVMVMYSTAEHEAALVPSSLFESSLIVTVSWPPNSFSHLMLTLVNSPVIGAVNV